MPVVSRPWYYRWSQRPVTAIVVLGVIGVTLVALSFLGRTPTTQVYPDRTDGPTPVTAVVTQADVEAQVQRTLTMVLKGNMVEAQADAKRFNSEMAAAGCAVAGRSGIAPNARSAGQVIDDAMASLGTAPEGFDEPRLAADVAPWPETKDNKRDVVYIMLGVVCAT